METANDKISYIKITGDFFLHPEECIDNLEKILIGILVEKSEIISCIENFIKNEGAIFVGADPDSITQTILGAYEI